MEQKKRLVVMWSLMLCLAWIPLALYAQGLLFVNSL